MLTYLLWIGWIQIRNAYLLTGMDLITPFNLDLKPLLHKIMLYFYYKLKHEEESPFEQLAGARYLFIPPLFVKVEETRAL